MCREALRYYVVLIDLQTVILFICLQFDVQNRYAQRRKLRVRAESVGRLQCFLSLSNETRDIDMPLYS
jgi:hypothetical protein